MASLWTPHLLWREQLDELEQDLNRIEALLDNDLIKQESGLGGKFGQLLGPLKRQVKDLRQPKKAGLDPPPADLRVALAVLTQECRALCAAQLELLGGIAITRRGFDDGFTKQAKQWLVELRDNLLGLDQRLWVIVGRGPLLAPDTGTVRLTFPDWDLWHLPLLGRALRLLATAPGSKYREALNRFADPLVEQVQHLLRDPTQPPPDLGLLLPAVVEIWHTYQDTVSDTARNALHQKQQDALYTLASQQRDFIHYLFADMLATALVGPVYALAVFILELDYCNPTQLDLFDPDQIEGREIAPRILPAPVHRAAAILATLQAMNREEERPPSQCPYTQIIKRLKELWCIAIQSAGRSDPFDRISQNYKTWYQAMYQDVIQPLAYRGLEKTEETWQQALMWHKALRHGQKPTTIPLEITALVSAIWLHRLDYPEQADNTLAMAHLLLKGKDSMVPLEGAGLSPAQVIVQARLERLAWRWKRVAGILKSEELPQEDRAAVAGRFYRLLSEQVYKLEQCQLFMQGENLRPSIWGKVNELIDSARPLQREALEFLGGWLVRQQELDREPESLTNLPHAGISICDLADTMLGDYAQRTGVNWAARTVLGIDPFLEIRTDIIRVRFPDWSLWNLPLMAHEFGHLVARSTPAFRDYQSEQAEQAFESYPRPDLEDSTRYIQARRSHLDEFFADVFATYTLGPAFVCDVIFLQFKPVEAYVWRGGHPSYQERVQVILQTLRYMNEKSRIRGCYTWLLDQVEQGWDAAVSECQVTPVDKTVYDFQLAQSLRWGRKLCRLVDTFYHLGAYYTPERWFCAQKIAERLLKLPVPALQEMIDIAEREEMALDDILNALWYARVRNPEPPIDLTAVAHKLARHYLGE